jgi:hydroxymethylbilane synthase
MKRRLAGKGAGDGGVRTVVFCSRGSPLALTQTRMVMGWAQELFPHWRFELEVLRTTGDLLQASNPAPGDPSLPKGLFTKELEVALLEGRAHVAVHSLKDLPTELPEGLCLAGVPEREDVRDVLLYRDADWNVRRRDPRAEWRPGMRRGLGFKPGLSLDRMPSGAVVATSSSRRAAMVKACQPGLEVIPVRGTVGTRLSKLAHGEDMDATLLAAAGMHRLGLRIGREGVLKTHPLRLPGDVEISVPEGICACLLDPGEVVPAVGQGALGLEAREDDGTVRQLCQALTHRNTWSSVMAERAFLQGMGGGCQSPMGAHARVLGHRLVLKAAVFVDGVLRRGECAGPVDQADELGRSLAGRLRDGVPVGMGVA